MNKKLADKEKFAIEMLNMIYASSILIEGINRTIISTSKVIEETNNIIAGTSKKIEVCNKKIKNLLVELTEASHLTKRKVEISTHVIWGAARFANNKN